MRDNPSEADEASSAPASASRVWEGCFRGVLSTQSQAEPGYPFGSVVPYCLDALGQPILLLSHLAQHCRNVDADPRCAFTVFRDTDGDIQQSERLTCLGDCLPLALDDMDSVHRYFRHFPQGRPYHETLNFRFYRLAPRRFHYNGGFATARWIGRDRVLRAPRLQDTQVERLAAKIEQGYPLLLRAPFADPGDDQAVPRVAGIDAWGLDVRLGDTLRRIPFPGAVLSEHDLHSYLQSLS